MKREQAESTVAYIYSECKTKLEKAIKEHLGVDTCLEFEVKQNGLRCYITGRDALSDVYEQMTATPLLRQLFEMAWLSIQVWDFDNEVTFGIAIDYQHNFRGGSNGHDLMIVGVRKDTGEVIVKK